MTKTFTKNDLVQYLYGETDQVKNQEIHIARLQDNRLDEEIDEFISLIQQISDIRFKASGRVIENVLQYSKNCSLEPVQ